jgi:Uma2 family endonuclease
MIQPNLCDKGAIVSPTFPGLRLTAEQVLRVGR